jgi:signal transduction histidine kinase
MSTAHPPTDAEAAPAKLQLGRRLYRQERWTEAVEVLAQALAEADKSLPGRLRGEVLFLHGMALVRAGSEAEGIDELEGAATAGWLEARFQLALLYARRGRRRGALRQRAIDHLEHIFDAEEGDPSLAAGSDRVCFALGGLYAEGADSGDAERAIAAFRRGLALNPLSAVGHNHLGQLQMRTAQPLSALGEFKVALQLDPDFRAAHSNLARLFFEHVKPDDLADEYAHIVEEFEARAPQVLARLSQELVELGREQVYRALYTKGHQLKNRIGVVGSRLRRVGRELASTTQASTEQLVGAGQALQQLETEHERLYEEWVGYLSAMTPDQLYTSLIDTARVVSRVADALAADRGTSIPVRIQEGVPRIEADERLVREAATNLCTNALDAVGAADPPGHVTLGVGYDEEAGVVYIEVEDDGGGIPAELLEHVFDPGYTTKDHGNGYGLAIARRIAQAHHGELRVKSRVGHGSVFRLDLPVNLDADSGPDTLAGSVL